MDKENIFFLWRRIKRKGKVLKYWSKYLMRDFSDESQKEKSSSWLNCALQEDNCIK